MYYRYEGGDSQLQDQLQHEISPSSINSDITPSTPSPSFVRSDISLITNLNTSHVSSERKDSHEWDFIYKMSSCYIILKLHLQEE